MIIGQNNRGAPRQATVVETMEPRRLMSIVPVSGEVLVNTGHTDNSQTIVGLQRSVAADRHGNHVVVFQNLSGTQRIVAQRYDSSGNPVGGNVLVNATGGSAEVAMAADGTFVVSWADYDDIYFQRFDAGGTRVGGTVRANTYTSGSQNMHSLALFGDGRVVATWVSAGQDGSGQGVYAQQFGPSNAKVGGEFRVNNVTAYDQNQTSIAADDTDGDFVITWESVVAPATSTSAAKKGIFGQRFDAAGGEAGGEFRVDDSGTAHTTTYGQVAFAPDGKFIVGWGEAPGTTTNSGWEPGSIFYRQYGADGAPLVGPVRVDSAFEARRGFRDISVDPAGGAVLTWQSDQGENTGYWNVFVRKVGATGAPIGGEIRANVNAGLYFAGASQPSVEHLGADRFVVAYTYDATGSAATFDVYTRRFDNVPGAAHNVEVAGLYAPNHTDLGKSVPVRVAVRNVGTSTEDVTVTLRDAGGAVIGSQTVTGLAPDTAASVLIDWTGAASLPMGWHDLSATVSLADGVTDEAPSNDTATDRVRFGVYGKNLSSTTQTVGSTQQKVLYGAGLSANTKLTFVGGTGAAPTAVVTDVWHEGRLYVNVTTYGSKKGGTSKTGGTWDLILTNPDGSSYRMVGALTVS